MKFKKIDRNTLKTELPNLKSDLKKLGKKYGLDIEVGTIKFDSERFSGKVDFTLDNYKNPTEKSTALKKKFVEQVNKNHIGINANKAFNSKFKYNGCVYKVIGYQPTRRKYPFLCENVNNKKQILVTEMIMKLHFKK